MIGFADMLIAWRTHFSQRAVPVVFPDGPSAGGGALLTAVDPGVPLGPGLLATCGVFHGPHTIRANRRMKAATTIAIVSRLSLLSRSLPSCMRVSTSTEKKRS